MLSDPDGMSSPIYYLAGLCSSLNWQPQKDKSDSDAKIEYSCRSMSLFSIQLHQGELSFGRLSFQYSVLWSALASTAYLGSNEA